ncbi:dTDP-4-dehydrorhamnose reductase [Desulfonema magnum]|uniref:dTDP-4-dehydrorhamnose reductase n=1 Tax=Desulfonema magnum TaxID=45655 RepID=A0A975GLL2_9BACT|nr:dTDP-4-dehydrorhamnose reductase [Desulfonema magnum]QTA85754.1 dTDP-4-dehydrorhamnose reductase [Desulfonema magnum]
MKILVTGSEGQLGWELSRQGDRFDFEIIGADLPETDITDIAQVENTLSNTCPALVINAAAYTAVDRAETEQTLAFAVNRDGPANLAASCAKMNIPLIHISTDFVFDGKKGTPYSETDPVSPLSVYGKSKAAGEDAVRSQTEAHIILRTAWLYGAHGQNFVKTMLRLGKEKEVIRVVADQYGSPTSAANLADAALSIARGVLKDAGKIAPSWGTYHYCGKGVTSWHGFTEMIFELAKPYGEIQTTRVEPVTTAEYPTAAKRPPFSALDCGRIQKNFGITTRPWQKSLKIIIDRIMLNTEQ